MICTQDHTHTPPTKHCQFVTLTPLRSVPHDNFVFRTWKLSNRDRDCEASRQEQFQLCPELRSREGAHQESRINTLQEVKELRTVRCSNAELRAEAFADALSQHEEVNLETELRESQSTVNQLAVQIGELQEMENSLHYMLRKTPNP